MKHQKQLFQSNEGSVGLTGVGLDAILGESRKEMEINCRGARGKQQGL